MLKPKKPKLEATPKKEPSILGDFDEQDFVQNYWQKRPLLIRQAHPNFKPILSAEELAGLSLEADIESRLIKGSISKGWQSTSGPLEEKTFNTLGDEDWTILIQSVDQWIPEIEALRNWIKFIPRWLFEDIMISYAVPGGSVGPHYDHYDVFLFQAEGSRRWMIGEPCTSQSEMISDAPLKLLKSFKPTQTWDLEAGDLLYLPAGIPHHGVAKTPTQTYSFGFRSPSERDFWLDFPDLCLEYCSDFNRLPSVMKKKSSLSLGQIDDSWIEVTKKMMSEILHTPELWADWLGTYCTRPKNPDLLNHEDGNLVFYDNDTFKKKSLKKVIKKNPVSRFAWYSKSSKHGGILYVDGKAYPIENNLLLKHLGNPETIDTRFVCQVFSKSDKDVLEALFENGSLQMVSATS